MAAPIAVELNDMHILSTLLSSLCLKNANGSFRLFPFTSSQYECTVSCNWCSAPVRAFQLPDQFKIRASINMHEVQLQLRFL
jgi:hypothetical protein